MIVECLQYSPLIVNYDCRWTIYFKIITQHLDSPTQDSLASDYCILDS